MPLESLLYSSSTSILISVLSFIAWPPTIDIGGCDDADEDPFELPFVLPLTLNIGFGIETICDFDELAIDWRLRIVDPVDLFFDDDLSNADFDSFFGCFSDARNL